MKKNINDIILSTAHSIDGYRVERTIDIVTSECAFGMNIFRDFFASLTDVFGGRSMATQNILKDARKVCLKELRKEAIEVEADAVIGIDLDYSEFSGKNKAMLFLIASGTAVKLKNLNDLPTTNNIASNNPITIEDLRDLIYRKKLLSKIGDNTNVFSDEEFDFLIRNDITEVVQPLLNKLKEDPNSMVLKSQVKKYLKNMPPKKVKPHCYKILMDSNNNLEQFIIDLIKELYLLDYDWIISLLKSEDKDVRINALKLLSSEKQIYGREDVDKLKIIHNLIMQNFQKIGQIVDVKSKFSSKTKKIWVCQCGSKNDFNLKYCKKCSIDIYGFTPSNNYFEQSITTVKNSYLALSEYYEIK